MTIPKPPKGTGKARRTAIKESKKKVAKTKRSTKPKIPKKVRDKCLAEFQKLRKLQESINGYCKCISCGKLIKYGETDCQGGHYITRANNATCIEHDNVWPQCAVCNVLRNGNPYAYNYNLVQKIGFERVNRIVYMALVRDGNTDVLDKLSEEDTKLALKKWTNKDWYEKYKEFHEEVKRLENERINS